MIDDNIEIVITAIDGDQVKIGIAAPREYAVMRKEVLDDVKANNQTAVSTKETMKQLTQWVKDRSAE